MGRPNPVPKNDTHPTHGQGNQIATKLARGLGKTSFDSSVPNDENSRPRNPHSFHIAAAKLEKKIRGPRAELFNPGLLLYTTVWCT
jgi:hypothetical protein